MIIKGAFEKARFYIESHTKDSSDRHTGKKQGPCITISRETGAGADLVSEELVKFFEPFTDEDSIPWTVFDRNLIEKVLEDHHLPHKLTQYFVEDKLSEFKTTVDELLGIHPPAWILVNKTAHTILQLALKGNVIIVGRAANIITSKLKNTFHIRLIASFDARVNHVAEVYNLSHKDAIEFTKKEDLARQSYFKKYYNREINDPLLYHMVINTDNIPFNKAAKMIGLAVLEKYPEMFLVDEERIYKLS